jgi:apolipoprotein N-acyltransferase
MNEFRPYLVFLSAILSVLAFPPFILGPLVFISLVPLLYAIDDLPPLKAFKFGYLWGVIFYLGLVYYIGWVTIPGLIATVLILALIPAMALWLYSRLAGRWPYLAIAIIPSFFLTLNWLLTKSDLNYPWTDFGYALSYYLPLIQAADIGGVYLLSLAIFVVNLLIFVSISNRIARKGSTGIGIRLAAVLVIILLYVYGMARIRKLERDPPADTLTVGLIQGNITKDIKWDRGGLQVSLDRYFSLSRIAADEGAELLIWPETAVPTYLAQEPENMAKVTSFVDDVGIPLLTGVVFYETDTTGAYIYYNSAILLEPGIQDYQYYSKVHLVPMSEKIPFSGRIKRLRDIHLGQADFTSGDEMTIFHLNDNFFNALICFESAFPDYTRQFTLFGSEFLVVITNDMWFGRTSLFEQHAMMSVIRAVENRVPVVRAANTGITMSVDKVGRILGKTPTFETAYLVTQIHPEISNSIYKRLGDFIPRTAGVLTLICLPIAFWKRKEYIDESYVE